MTVSQNSSSNLTNVNVARSFLSIEKNNFIVSVNICDHDYIVSFRTQSILFSFSGVVEASSYMIPLPLLRLSGRRNVTTCLLMTASFSLLILLIIPSNMTGCKVAASLLGRLCVSAVFSVIIIHAFELFPTMTRNTAVGSSSSMAHVGSVFAPYLVDFFVSVILYNIIVFPLTDTVVPINCSFQSN